MLGPPRLALLLLAAGTTQTIASEFKHDIFSLQGFRRSSVCLSQQLLLMRGGSTMTSWRTWAYKALAKMGIFLKKGKLLVLGLDNAGKSTLLTVLKQNEVVPTAPTHQPVTDEIKVGYMKLRAVDMGGHEIARRMWLQYSHEADGVVYIVDACDRERFMEAALELHKLLAASALPSYTPVLILGNKGDLPHAATQEELYWGLGLDELFKKVRHLCIHQQIVALRSHVAIAYAHRATDRLGSSCVLSLSAVGILKVSNARPITTDVFVCSNRQPKPGEHPRALNTQCSLLIVHHNYV